MSGNFAHTHSLCLSLFLPFQSKDHTCTQKKNVCKMFFLGGKGIVLLKKVDNLAFYIKMCKGETSKFQNAWVRDMSTTISSKPGQSFPAASRFHGEGNGNPLQYSYLENPMEIGALWATVHGVAKNGHDWETSLSGFQGQTHTQVSVCSRTW